MLLIVKIKTRMIEIKEISNIILLDKGLLTLTIPLCIIEDFKTSMVGMKDTFYCMTQILSGKI